MIFLYEFLQSIDQCIEQYIVLNNNFQLEQTKPVFNHSPYEFGLGRFVKPLCRSDEDNTMSDNIRSTSWDFSQ